MKKFLSHVCLVALVLVLTSGFANAATLNYYTTRAAFDLAHPGLSIDDLSEVACGVNCVVGVDGPLALAAPGLTLDSDPVRGPGGQGLAITGMGFAGQVPGTMAYANFFPDTLNMFFSGGVMALGADLGSLFDASLIDISFYDAGDLLLGTQSFLGTSVGTGFFGVDSDVAIHRINLSSQTGQAEGVTNITSCADCGQVTPAPEPAIFVLMGAGLAGLAGLKLRKS